MLISLADIHDDIVTVEQLHAYTGLILVGNYSQSFPFVDRLGNQGNYYYAQIKEARKPDGSRLKIFEVALPLLADSDLVARRPWLQVGQIENNAAFPNAWKNANL